MRKFNAVLILVVAGMIAAAPTTQSVHSLADVDAIYQNRAKAAKRTFDDEISKAEEDRLQGLRLLENRAIKAEDLDEAIAIKGRIEDLKKDTGVSKNEIVSQEIKARRVLEGKLAGTRWHEDPHHPNTIWTLNNDGTVTISDGRSAKWAAIASNAILIRTANGYADEWTFDDDLKKFKDVNGELSLGWSSVRAE